MGYARADNAVISVQGEGGGVDYEGEGIEASIGVKQGLTASSLSPTFMVREEAVGNYALGASHCTLDIYVI